MPTPKEDEHCSPHDIRLQADNCPPGLISRRNRCAWTCWTPDLSRFLKMKTSPNHHFWSFRPRDPETLIPLIVGSSKFKNSCEIWIFCKYRGSTSCKFSACRFRDLDNGILLVIAGRLTQKSPNIERSEQKSRVGDTR